MLRHYLINVILLGFGILIGYTLLSNRSQEETVVGQRDTASTQSLNSTPSQPGNLESLVALRQQLNDEKKSLEQLRTGLEALQIRVEELERKRDVESGSTTNRVTARLSPKTDSIPVVRSSVQGLIDAGISEQQATWLQERLDENELQQLYLRDRATREGWLNTARYHKERQQYLNVVKKLRDEVDDDVYDRLLYTLGKANRVVIRDVMQNSSAGQYGLQSGDGIIEYDGQRIFDSNELSSLVSQGDVGVMTLVRIKRDGETHDIYLPRGPLGIRMSAVRQAP